MRGRAVVVAARAALLLIACSGCDAHLRIDLLQPASNETDGQDGGAEDAATDARPARARPDASRSTDANMDPEDSGTRDGDNPDRDAAPPPTQDDAGDDGARSAEAMVLRYDFAGEGTVVFDLVGMADGAVRGGATLDGRGGVQLDGYDDFVDLPNGTISGLTETTIMVWLRWDGGTCWQRVFDFGSSTNAEGEVGRAHSSIFLTPWGCGGGGLRARIEFGSFETSLTIQEALPRDRLVQLALSIDPEADRVALYLDGRRIARGPAPFTLSQIRDWNVWLGRSQWVQDYNLQGRYEELRIYDRALTDAQVREAFDRGYNRP